MAYCNQQYDRYRELDADLLEQLEQQPEQYPKYVQFIRGFVSLLEICERIVVLLKVCLHADSGEHGQDSQDMQRYEVKVCQL